MMRFYSTVALIVLCATLPGTARAQRGGTAPQHVHGHKLVRHPSGLGNGRHQFHSTPTAHRLHVQVHRGRVHQLHVHNRHGHAVRVHRHVIQGYVRFAYYDAWYATWVYVWFPVTWVW